MYYEIFFHQCRSHIRYNTRCDKTNWSMKTLQMKRGKANEKIEMPTDNTIISFSYVGVKWLCFWNRRFI